VVASAARELGVERSLQAVQGPGNAGAPIPQGIGHVCGGGEGGVRSKKEERVGSVAPPPGGHPKACPSLNLPSPDSDA